MGRINSSRTLLFKWVRADSEAVGRPDIDRRLRGFPQLAASSTASPALCTSSPAPSTLLQALMNKAPERSRAPHISLVMIVSCSLRTCFGDELITYRSAVRSAWSKAFAPGVDTKLTLTSA